MWVQLYWEIRKSVVALLMSEQGNMPVHETAVGFELYLVYTSSKYQEHIHAWAQ